MVGDNLLAGATPTFHPTPPLGLLKSAVRLHSDAYEVTSEVRVKMLRGEVSMKCSILYKFLAPSESPIRRLGLSSL